MGTAAEYCLVELLFAKTPTITYTHFVECVLFLNGLEPRRVLDKFATSMEAAMTRFAGRAPSVVQCVPLLPLERVRFGHVLNVS